MNIGGFLVVRYLSVLCRYYYNLLKMEVGYELSSIIYFNLRIVWFYWDGINIMYVYFVVK